MIASNDVVADPLISLPAHWSRKRLRSVAQLLVSNVDKKENDSEVRIRLCNYTDVYKNQRITNRLAFMAATASKDEIDRFRLRLADVIITKDSESWDDIAVPSLVEYEAPDLVCGYHLAILRPREGVTGAFLLRALQSTDVAAQFYIRASGITRYGLSQDAIKSAVVPVPPREEQDAIVRFLDYMDRRMRRYIAAKQRLIRLLQEKRAVMTAAAMRADVRSVRIAAVVDRQERPVRRVDEEGYIPIGLYNRGRGIFHKPFTRGLDLGDSNFFWVHEGDLVISGQFAWEGAVALAGSSDQDCIASHRYPILRGKPSAMRTEYLLSFFQTDWGQMILDHHSRGAAGRNRPLNLVTLSKEKIPLPTLDKQDEIAKFFHLESQMRKEVDSLITYLREYRIRLISDVVTGKLDVRGIEPPDERYGDEDIADAGIEDAELDEMIEEAVEEEEAVAN